MLKKHINKHVKGENSQKAKKGQKRAITQLRKKTTANLLTKESNKNLLKCVAFSDATHGKSNPGSIANQEHGARDTIPFTGFYHHTHLIF